MHSIINHLSNRSVAGGRPRPPTGLSGCPNTCPGDSPHVLPTLCSPWRPRQLGRRRAEAVIWLGRNPSPLCGRSAAAVSPSPFIDVLDSASSTVFQIAWTRWSSFPMISFVCTFHQDSFNMSHNLLYLSYLLLSSELQGMLIFRKKSILN